MVLVRSQRTLSLSLFFILMMLSLSGCFKMDVSLDVKQNGSGKLGIAMGMTQDAKALLASQGTQNPTAVLQRSLSQDAVDAGVTVTKWTEGEYEWTQLERESLTIEQINTVIARMELFETFSLQRNPGLFQDEFILDARLAPLSDSSDTLSDESSAIDASAFIQVTFSARLPGTIRETNGITSKDDPNHMTWTVQSNQQTRVQARSTAWNWLNIGIIGGCAFLVALAVLAVIGFLLFKVMKSPKKVPAVVRTASRVTATRAPRPKPSTKNIALRQPPPMHQNTPVAQPKSHQPAFTVQPPPAMPAAPASSINSVLSDLGVEKLLMQVNDKVLNRAGHITKEDYRVCLSWTDRSGHPRAIDVRDFNETQVVINGEICDSTHEEVKASIVKFLKQFMSSGS